MAKVCVGTSNPVMLNYKGFDKKINKIGEKARSYIYYMNYVQTEDMNIGILNPISGIKKVDGLIEKISDGKYKSLSALENAPEQTRNFVELQLDRWINDLDIAKKDYRGLIEQSMVDESFSNLVKYNMKMKGVEDNARMVYNINKKIGVNHEVLHNNRYTAMKKHPVPKKLYAEYQMFKNYLSHGKILIGNFKDKIKGIHQTTKIKSENISKMLTFYDERHETGKAGLRDFIKQHINEKDFQRFQKRVEDNYDDVGAEELENRTVGFVVDIMDELAKEWRGINGSIDDTEDNINTIIGFTRGANKRLKSLIDYKVSVIKKYNPDATDEELNNMLNPIEKRYLQLLEDWKPRKGYVPARSIDDNNDLFSDMFKLGNLEAEDKDLNYTPVMSFLNKRRDAVEGTSDSLDILTKNLMALDFTYGHISQYVMASTIKLAMDAEKGSSWSEKNPGEYNTIKYFADNMLEYMKPRKQLSAPLQALRNMALVVAGSPALILGFPNSVAANYAGGFMSIYSKFGIKSFHDMYLQYKKAPNQGAFEKIIHDAVGGAVEAEHKQPGRLQDYMIFDTKVGDADVKNGLVKSTKTIRDAAFKTYDAVTAKGILSWLPIAHNLTTMHGSESFLRKQADAVLYSKVYNELFQQKGNYDLSKPSEAQKFNKLVADTIEHYKIDTYYEMAEALGEFNQENKPFWTWARLKYAENFSDIVVGTAGALWGAFRQVAVHNIDRFGKAGVGMFMKVKDGQNIEAEIIRGASTQSGMRLDYGLPFVGALALAIWDMVQWAKGKSGIKAPLAQNINPFQETNAVLQAGYVGLAKGLLNLPCSEEMADEGIKKILQLAGGVGGGGGLRELYQGVNEENLGDRFSAANPFKMMASYFELPSVIYEMSRGITADQYYSYKSEVMAPLQNPYPMTSYLNDYLRTAHQMLPILFAKGKDDVQNDILTQKKLKNTQDIVTSMVGLRAYTNVNEAWKAHYADVRMRNKLHYMIEREEYEEYEAKTIIDKMIDGIARYGNMNPKYIIPGN